MNNFNIFKYFCMRLGVRIQFTIPNNQACQISSCFLLSFESEEEKWKIDEMNYVIVSVESVDKVGLLFSYGFGTNMRITAASLSRSESYKGLLPFSWLLISNEQITLIINVSNTKR